MVHGFASVGGRQDSNDKNIPPNAGFSLFFLPLGSNS